MPLEGHPVRNGFLSSARSWSMTSHVLVFSYSREKRRNNKDKFWKSEIHWTFLSIVLRLGLDLSGCFRCHSLSLEKILFSPVVDCWRQWVASKTWFKPLLWVRAGESDLCQEHRISDNWASLSFVLRPFDIFRRLQKGCCVGWSGDKLVLRGTPKAQSLVWFQQEENLTVNLPCPRWISMSLGCKIGRSKKALVCESSCLLLLATLQNRNAGLSKIFFIITQIPPVLILH